MARKNTSLVPLKRRFYGLMRNKEYETAYDFLMNNSEILQNMTISELADHYKIFRVKISVEKTRGLVRLLDKAVFDGDLWMYP